MPRHPASWLAALLLLLPLHALAAPPSAKDAFDQGKQLLSHQRYAEAEARFQTCVTQAPADADCHLMLGAAQARLGRLEEGARSYREFLRLAPKDRRAPLVKRIVETYERSRDSITNSLVAVSAPTPTPQSEPARTSFEQGREAMVRQRYAEAEAHFSACTTQEPTFADCFLLLGSAQARQGRPEEGRAAYEEFMRLAPAHPKAPLVRRYLQDYTVFTQALSPARESDSDEAAPTEAAAPTPSSVRALYDEGRMAMTRQRLADAEARFQACVKQEPTYADCHMMLGATQARLGRVAEGAKSYREFLRLAPNHPKAPMVRRIVKDYDQSRGR